MQPFLSGMLNIENEATWERVYGFDEPPYYGTLDAVMSAAAERGMQLDLTHFSGGPPGGPEINLDDSLTVMAHAAERVKGGRTVALELPKPGAGASEYIFTAMEFTGADFINFPAANARLLSVLAARVVAGEHGWSPFDLDDTVTLDPASVQVLTARVEGGVLHWEAPPGEWQIIASYLLPSGEVPMGAAQKPQGFVVDHLRKRQVLGHYEYAFGKRTGLPAHYGRGLRGFFNDSLEFRVKRMSVEDILPEFRARRGYDLEPLLPAIYVEGKDNVYFREIVGIHAAPEFELTAQDERIRHDYQKTLSDLVIERFVETSASWAAQRGLVSRGQSYGMDLDILRALGANTIPETEQLWAGGSDLGLKMASSAAALYGRPLVSAGVLRVDPARLDHHAAQAQGRRRQAAARGREPSSTTARPTRGQLTRRSPTAKRAGRRSAGRRTRRISPRSSVRTTRCSGRTCRRSIAISRAARTCCARASRDRRADLLPVPRFSRGQPRSRRARAAAEWLHSRCGSAGRCARGSGADQWQKDAGCGVHASAEAGRRARRVGAHAAAAGARTRPARHQLGLGQRPLAAEREDRRAHADGLWRQLPAVLVANAPMIEQQTLHALAGLEAEGVPVVFAGALPERQPGYLDAAQGDREVQ
ncbi:MAG: hypothetical protein IPM40_07355 [Gammaproteobacteria bacterium]|nr:hypothetical protein [Gammaproteobacteria bacterium]